MANRLTRALRALTGKAAEGEYRPGPYLLGGGLLSAKAGGLLNWWQSGFSPMPFGESGAMVEACVSAYSQTVAMCPGTHWRLLADGGRERVSNSALARILKSPNDYESISDFLLNMTDRLYRQGEAFAYAPRNDRGEVKEIHRMRDGRPRLGRDGSVYYSLAGNEIAEMRFDFETPVPARDVLHLRLHTPRHPLKGVSPITAAALELAMSGAALNQQVQFYLNEARPSFMLETDEKLNAQQTTDLRDRWNEQTRGDGAGGTPILAWGLKAKAVSTSAHDNRLADMLKLSDQNVALAFRMPLQILGVGGTPFASTEALMASWKATGLGFVLNHIEEALGRLFGLKGMPDEYLELDTDALLRSSFKEMIDALTNGTKRLLTSNEARAKLGYGRKEGGDQLFVQMQDVPIQDAGKSTQPVITPPADDADEPELSDDEAGEAAEKALHAAFRELPAPLLLTKQ